MQRRLCSFDWPFLKISAMKHVFVLSQKPTHILPYHYRKEASILFLVIWWVILFEYLYSLIRAVSSYSPLPLGKSSAPKQNNFQLSLPSPPPPLPPLLGISATDLVCIFSLLLARQIKWIQEFNNPERTVQIKRAFATQKKTIKTQTGSAWNFFQPQTQVCSRFLNLFQINCSLLLLLPLFQRIFQSPD